MNVRYTGRQVELSEAQKKKLDARLQRIQKVLKRHQPEAHVILSQERGRYRAEVTVNFRHHTMVVECINADATASVQEAVEKLEKQIIRNKDKWREKKRRAKPVWEMSAEAPAPASRENGSAPRIFRSTPRAAKPLTVEEAVIELEQDGRDCVVYQDADKGRLSVLFRRRDGNLELIEG